MRGRLIGDRAGRLAGRTREGGEEEERGVRLVVAGWTTVVVLFFLCVSLSLSVCVCALCFRDMTSVE